MMLAGLGQRPLALLVSTPLLLKTLCSSLLTLQLQERVARCLLHNLKCYAALARSPTALFVFRHCLDDVSIQSSHFNINRAELGLNFYNLSFKRTPPDFVKTHA